jgi:hypothetical protein
MDVNLLGADVDVTNHHDWLGLARDKHRKGNAEAIRPCMLTYGSGSLGLTARLTQLQPATIGMTRHAQKDNPKHLPGKD